MTKRQSILSDFETLTKTITTANGYPVDMQTNEIHKHNTRVLNDTTEKYINIIDGKNEHSDGDNGVYQTMEYTFEVGCIKGDDNYDTITNMIYAVYKMVYDNQSFFDNKYGYFVILPVEDDFGIYFEQNKNKEIAEGYVKIELTHSVKNKWILENNNY